MIAIGYTKEDPHPPKRPLDEDHHWKHYPAGYPRLRATADGPCPLRKSST